MILIIAPEDDLHAQIVKKRVLDFGCKCEILNTTFFPWIDELSLNDNFEFYYKTKNKNIFSKEISAIWWRRFKRPTVSPEIIDNNTRQYCYSEALALLQGIFDTAKCPIYNNPMQERISSSKIYQLQVAKNVGLKIPKTLISNRKEDLLNFYNYCDRNCIVKTLKCDYPHSIETKIITDDLFADNTEIKLTNLFIQETISAVCDIRVTIIGKKIFAAQLERNDINETVDWRMTPNGWSQHKLPMDIEEKILNLNSELKLQFSSSDLRKNKDGEYYFLETNPNGQFLFLEIDAGYSISNEIAYYLKFGKNSS